MIVQADVYWYLDSGSADNKELCFGLVWSLTIEIHPRGDLRGGSRNSQKGGSGGMPPQENLGKYMLLD